jgi:myo-inositol-1(or 4)-monophosphatase
LEIAVSKGIKIRTGRVGHRRFDAFSARDTKSWDVAAGSLLVREAGGLMTDLAGGPFSLARPRFIAAATEPLHGQLRALIQ